MQITLVLDSKQKSFQMEIIASWILIKLLPAVPIGGSYVWISIWCTTNSFPFLSRADASVGNFQLAGQEKGGVIKNVASFKREEL